MEFLGKLSLYIHILAGIITLVAGPIAIWGNSNMRIHRWSGKLFFYAMVIVVVTSVIGFIKHPTSVFHQFLLGISIIVGYNVFRGVRSILIMKKLKSWSSIDLLGLKVFLYGSVAMLIYGVYFLAFGGSTPMGILFSVFGFFSIKDARAFIKVIPNALADSRWWFMYHINSMFAAFMASTTAFAVNAASFAPWYIQWFAPTLILLPVQFYFLHKRRVSRRHLQPKAEPVMG